MPKPAFVLVTNLHKNTENTCVYKGTLLIILCLLRELLTKIDFVEYLCMISRSQLMYSRKLQTGKLT